MNRQLAKKLNDKIIRNAKKPHERDTARMRLNIIKKAKQRSKNDIRSVFRETKAR